MPFDHSSSSKKNNTWFPKAFANGFDCKIICESAAIATDVVRQLMKALSDKAFSKWCALFLMWEVISLDLFSPLCTLDSEHWFHITRRWQMSNSVAITAGWKTVSHWRLFQVVTKSPNLVSSSPPLQCYMRLIYSLGIWLFSDLPCKIKQASPRPFPPFYQSVFPHIYV